MSGLFSILLFQLLTKHNTPPIHKLSQQQNKTQMLLLVLVHLV